METNVNEPFHSRGEVYKHTRIFVKSIENIVAFMQIDTFANNQYQSNRMNAFVMLIVKCNNNL